MAKMSDRKRLFLVVGACVLVAGGLGALAYADRQEVETIETEIQGLDADIARANAEIAKIRKREDDLIVFRAVEEKELDILPKEQEIADFQASLSGYLSSSGARFKKIPDNVTKQSELAAGVWVTPNTLDFDADARALLRLIHTLEMSPRLTAVKGLSVKSGGRTSAESTSPVHPATLNLEMYYYKPASAAKAPVRIPDEAQRLESPEIRKEIDAFQPERRDSYVLKPSQSRRDPFVDVRREVVVDDPERLKKLFAAEETLVLEVEKIHDDLREKVEEEKALEADSDLFRRDRLSREVNELVKDLRSRLEQLGNLKRVTLPQMVERIDRLKASLEAIASLRKDLPALTTVTRSVAESTVKMFEDALGRDDYGEVASLASTWEQFVAGKAIEPDAVPVLKRIKELSDRARTLAEFHAIGIDVTGVMVNPENPSQSAAIVDGTAVGVGQVVGPKGNEAKVVEITREGVTFEFRSQRIYLSVKESQARKDAGKKGARPAPGRRR